MMAILRLVVGNCARQYPPIMAVSPMHTSRACPAYGHSAKDNRPYQSAYAVVNATRNILAAECAVMACGGSLIPCPFSGARAVRFLFLPGEEDNKT